jgi:hypothetical protein
MLGTNGQKCDHSGVRTTLTLDDDVAKSIRQEMRRRGISSWKAAVNYFLRLGLAEARQKPKAPVVIEPRPLGLPTDLGSVCTERLLEKLEGSDYR